MAHNLHGDIPADDLKMAEELLEMETYFDNNASIYGPAKCAKMMVCCSHDWYVLGDDDKGRQLLEKADKICPGYFESRIKQDTKNGPQF